MGQKVRGHTTGELWLAIRQERADLVRERGERVRSIAAEQRRVDEIDGRLRQLDTAENILEGEM